ncbi:hypothetical protein IPA_01640 [Ignicoccus pacificus DSM 13166]|uniref:Uncharacterized protein n=1 Tax=Ignicoccus pacificus DSM 13166 TaxID=940294 RepID=A0A977KAI7_9CREN|nr:hypothetical protein IPA_01640 [Ignicoccus pacificus DSM 13166]
MRLTTPNEILQQDEYGVLYVKEVWEDLQEIFNRDRRGRRRIYPIDRITNLLERNVPEFRERYENLFYETFEGLGLNETLSRELYELLFSQENHDQRSSLTGVIKIFLELVFRAPFSEIFISLRCKEKLSIIYDTFQDMEENREEYIKSSIIHLARQCFPYSFFANDTIYVFHQSDLNELYNMYFNDTVRRNTDAINLDTLFSFSTVSTDGEGEEQAEVYTEIRRLLVSPYQLVVLLEEYIRNEPYSRVIHEILNYTSRPRFGGGIGKYSIIEHVISEPGRNLYIEPFLHPHPKRAVEVLFYHAVFYSWLEKLLQAWFEIIRFNVTNTNESRMINNFILIISLIYIYLLLIHVKRRIGNRDVIVPTVKDHLIVLFTLITLLHRAPYNEIRDILLENNILAIVGGERENILGDQFGGTTYRRYILFLLNIIYNDTVRIVDIRDQLTDPEVLLTIGYVRRKLLDIQRFYNPPREEG